MTGRCVVVAALALTGSMTWVSCAEPVRVDGTSETIAALQSRIPALMETADVPGFTMAVAEGTEIVASMAFGMASAELGRPATTETIFEAASLGKVVLALVTLRLADQGVLDLDDPLGDVLEYPLLDHDERYAMLTPRLILQHASGLPNWGGWALDEEREPVHFVAEPGDGFGYSGEAFVALQRFVETRTGRGLEALFVELAAEIGMVHSSFVSHAQDVDLYARARGSGGEEREILVFDRAIASFSLVSTAEDLARFAAFYFASGGLGNSAFAESLEPALRAPEDAWGSHVPGEAEISWTLAWALQELDGERMYFHAGNNGEFRSFIAYSPSRDTAVAVMANGEGGLSFLSEVLEPLVGEVTPAAVWWGYE